MQEVSFFLYLCGLKQLGFYWFFLNNALLRRSLAGLLIVKIDLKINFLV